MNGTDIMQQDIRYALRSLARSPGYTLIAVVVLALGIGATSAIFSFVDGVLLRPLPYAAPDRIVMLWERPPAGLRNSISTMNFLDWQQQAGDVLESQTAMVIRSVMMSGPTEPLRVHGQRVSTGYFDVFALAPALGRTFRADDGRPGSERVAVISHRLWRESFGADSSVVGRVVVLDGAPHTIIGVMPTNTPFDRGWTDMWRPLVFGPDELSRNVRWLQVTARLKPGVTIGQAQARLDAIGARMARDYPASNKDWGIFVESLADASIDSGLRRSLNVLFAAVGLLLLVGCANVANLALARGTTREREIVVRAALGASRGRIVRQLLTESIVLSTAGGALGLAIGYLTMGGLRLLLPPLYLPAEAMVTMDLRALLFALSISIGTGLVFGTAPAFQAGRVDLAGSLRESSRTATSDHGRRLRDGLVVVELALSCVLLVGAGLLMRSFLELRRIDAAPGARSLLTAFLPTPQGRFKSEDDARAFYHRLYDRVRATPGVAGLAFASTLPLQGWWNVVPITISGVRPLDDPYFGGRGAGFKMITPGYFNTIGLPLVRGRDLRDTDTAAAPPVVVINQRLADQYFAGIDPIGRTISAERIVPGQPQLGPPVAWQIVGIVANERTWTPEAPDSAGMYTTLDQSPQFLVQLIARTTGGGTQIARAVKAAVREVDPNQTVSEVRTLQDIKDETTAPNRLQAGLLGAFSGLALILAAVGIYGVISYSVAQRTREIGLRAALGATRASLVGMVLRRAVVLTAFGLALGMAGAVTAGRFMAGLLFGITPHDGVSMAVAGITLGAAALLASWIPARRAAAVDPIAALRVE
jgi:putative ABC transport system permease protein